MSSTLRSRLALLVLALAQFLLALDFTIIFVALPVLGADLGFSPSNLQWVVSAFALVNGGFLLIGGRLSDLLGRRRMFVVAITLFGLGSLLGGLAQTQALLILARGLQGLGGALLSPATLSLIMSTFGAGPARNRALALWAAMGSVGLSAGLIFGGVLTSFVNWEATFLVNVPVVIAMLLLAPRVLQESPRPEGPRVYDLGGALSVTLGMILVVFALIQGPVVGWQAALVPGLAGAALLALFVLLEARGRAPLLPLSLLALPTLWGASLIAVLFSASFGSLYYFLTLYAQQVLSLSAVETGLLFFPLALSALLATRWLDRIVARGGVAATTAGGFAFGIVGFLWLYWLTPGLPIWSAVPAMVLIGLGQGAVFTSMYIAGTTNIAPERQGVASAVVTTGQQLGSAIGLAVIVALISAQWPPNVALEELAPDRLGPALTTAFALEAVIAALAVGTALLVLRSPVPRRSEASVGD